jgi:hypothetical protein
VFQQINGFATTLSSRLQDLLLKFQQTIRGLIQKQAHAKTFVRLVWSLFKILLRPIERGSLLPMVIKQPRRLVTVHSVLRESSGGPWPADSFMDQFYGHCILCDSQFLEVSRASIAEYSWSEWARAVDVRSSLAQAPLCCRFCHEIACSKCFSGQFTTIRTFDCPFCGSFLWLEEAAAGQEMFDKARAFGLDSK